MKKHHLYPICFTAALAAFTLYAVLDTFVITYTFQENASGMNTAMFETEAPAVQSVTETRPPETSEAPRKNKPSDRKKPSHSREKPAVTTAAPETEAPVTTAEPEPAVTPIESEKTGLFYSDENISIVISEYYENNTHIYAADIRLISAQYLKSAFADKVYGRNVTKATSVIAGENGAILAINGDFYGARGRGCVLRNGVGYREPNGSEDIYCLFADGRMEARSSGGLTCDGLISEKAWQAWSFGPALIKDGEIAVDTDTEVGIAMADNPRTAIGMVTPLHYLFVVSDGRTEESKGLSLYDLADFMKRAGAVSAYNLDGGGSSTMYFKGELVNKPTSTGQFISERSVSDIVYIG